MNWISIKERKPTDWEQVLIALENKAVVVGCRGPMGWHWNETENPEDQESCVTHWMLWPKAPEA